MRRRTMIAAAIGWSVATAIAAHAQIPGPPPTSRPLLVSLPQPTTLSQRPVLPLSALQMDRLNQVIELRESGLLDRARDALTALLAEVPHHPLILSELARTQLAKQDFAGVEKLGRLERAASKDSLLLGREMTVALERLGRPRDAAEIVIEMWAVAMPQTEWATSTLVRLATLDPKGVQETLRRASDRLPARLDLLRGLAQVQWQTGDPIAARKTLAMAEQRGLGPGVRWNFAEDLMRRTTTRDSSGAIEVLLDLAAETSAETNYRVMSARRAWDVFRARGAESEGAPRVAKALADLPPERWQPTLVADVARGLRRAGLTDQARSLLKARGETAELSPDLALEQALTELRDGPPEKALNALAVIAGRSAEATFRYAEALFYAGESDSALASFKRISKNPEDPFTGAALERIYLIEEAQPKSALPVFGRLFYEEWRGDSKRALMLADSLYRLLPRGPSWAQAGMILSTHLESAGDSRAAIPPVLAIADSLPGDRLAPLARQRAGDLYLKLKEDARAIEQYEECLARYPRAWNAAEVRRKLEASRRDRRF